jgi:hypothetical protein
MDKNSIILVQNHYHSEKRMDEVLFCLEQNIKNKLIDYILLFVDNILEYNDYENILHSKFGDDLYDKVTAVPTYRRPTFDLMFEYMNNRGVIDYPDNSICLLANLDIFFDKTLEHVKNFDKWDDYIMALTRWEYDGHKKSHYLNWDHSQDVWIWKSPLNVDGIRADFPLGMQGCDNRIAYELGKNYDVINPCKTIRCHHYHTTQFRTYKPGDLSQTVPEPHVRVKHIEMEDII